jgi:two-component system response regulator FixJ
LFQDLGEPDLAAPGDCAGSTHRAPGRALKIALALNREGEPERQPRTMGKNQTPVRPTATILIVDDDVAVRDSLKFSLELEGFTVRLYADGRELLSEPNFPDDGCLVIDEFMPGLSGLETVDALRRRGKSIPVILVTSHPSSAIRHGATARGVVIIEKPFFGHALVDSIHDVMARLP